MTAHAQIEAGGLGARGGPLCAAVVGIVLVVAGLGRFAPDAPVLRLIGQTHEPVEAPPAEFDGKPFDVLGVTERLFDTKAEVDAYCRSVLTATLAEGRYFRACYVPDMKVIALPRAGAVSAKEHAELRAHEWAHARSWRHPLPPLDMKRLLAEFRAREAR